MEPELVTVIIPAHDEARFIDACLRSVRAQDYPHLQIVVIDGASTDATADIVREHCHRDDRVEMVGTDVLNIPVSLNLGLAHARGAFLVRVDAHSTIPESYVRSAVTHLRSGSWGGVGGRKDGVGRTPAGRAIAVAMSSRLAVGGSVYHFGTRGQEVDHLPFGAYPVATLRGVGGWDESLTANEDFELDHRLRTEGRALWFDPTMVIHWHCRQSLPELFTQYRRYGRGKVDVAILHPTSLRPRHLAPPLLVLYLIGAALLGAGRPRWSVALVMPYALALVVESARLAPRLAHPGEQLRVPVAIASMHLGWGLGFWSGIGRRFLARLHPG